MRNQTEADTRKPIKLDAETWKELKHRQADTQRPMYLQIRDLVFAGAQPPFMDERPGGGGEGHEYCQMVKDCMDAGEPWATQIRGVVMAIYEKMKRES